MKVVLSKPNYKIDQRILGQNKPYLRDTFRRAFIRRRIPFFMDGYRYAAAAVKKRWGIDVCFFEAGHGVMPCYISEDIDRQGAEIWWQKMNKNKRFARNLAAEVYAIVGVEKRLARSVPQRALSRKEAIKFLLNHLNWWVRFFEVAYLWFGVQNIKDMVDAEIRKIWKEGDKELDKFLEAVYRPIKFPASSIEQRDLVKLARLSGPALDRALKKHEKRYHHLSLHNIDDEYFDEAYYRGRVDVLKDPAEFKKMKESLGTADRELKAANALVRKAKIPAYLKDRINFVRWFMYIRTETVDHMMLVNGAYKSVFESLARILSLPVEMLLHMTYEELVSSVKRGGLSITYKVIADRTNKGYAYLIAPHGSFLVTGGDVKKLNDFVIPPKKKEKVTTLKGQAAFQGKVSGRARIILDRRNAHTLRKGEILVTTMTSPEFVPAMKIAAGIITNEGGILCHAAIMSRELRKPCIIGTKIATDVIKTGQVIMLDANVGLIKLV